jgi:Carboxypeptidase regulatory-like domain
MRRHLALAGALLALMGWISSPGWAQQAVDVEGRVFDQANGRGLENLEVRMTPPTGTSLPVRLAYTDENGVFRFPQVRSSRYLLEVSQGPNLLYRVQIDAGPQTHLEIPLQKR